MFRVCYLEHTNAYEKLWEIQRLLEGEGEAVHFSPWEANSHKSKIDWREASGSRRYFLSSTPSLHTQGAQSSRSSSSRISSSFVSSPKPFALKRATPRNEEMKWNGKEDHPDPEQHQSTWSQRNAALDALANAQLGRAMEPWLWRERERSKVSSANSWCKREKINITTSTSFKTIQQNKWQQLNATIYCI